MRNPAFDVTPAELITGIITERGVVKKPNRARVAALARTERRARPAGSSRRRPAARPARTPPGRRRGR
ncbi:MAG TPA: hypothetical protein VFZ54_20785 [Burkholderiales bacterium]